MGKLNKLSNKKVVNIPIEKRLEIYNKSLELKKEGFTAIEIWKKLKKENMEIKYETLRSWINGKRKPDRKLNILKKFDKGLSYVVGILLGDGCFYKVIKKGSYVQGRIVLGVKEKELAEYFALLSTDILGKSTNYKIRWSNPQKVYIVEFCSKQLVELLSAPLPELKKVIEISKVSFLKGIFDAEGSVSIKYQNNRIYPRIFLTNSDIELIRYVKSLLEEINIKSTIQINTIAGKTKFIYNKNTITRKTCYNLSIENIGGVKNFEKLINFTIYRKKRKLMKVISWINKNGNYVPIQEWGKLKL